MDDRDRLIAEMLDRGKTVQIGSDGKPEVASQSMAVRVWTRKLKNRRVTVIEADDGGVSIRIKRLGVAALSEPRVVEVELGLSEEAAQALMTCLYHALEVKSSEPTAGE